LPQVILRPPTAQGRLYWFPDPEVAHFLFDLETDPKRVGLRGRNFNIASYLLIDLDIENVPTHIEAIIPTKAWKQLPSLDVPLRHPPFDMAFTDATAQLQVQELKVSITTNPDLSCVQIMFDGEQAGADEWIELSADVLTAVRETSLLGFFVEFAEPHGQWAEFARWAIPARCGAE
jgi:hypothetical protein